MKRTCINAIALCLVTTLMATESIKPAPAEKLELKVLGTRPIEQTTSPQNRQHHEVSGPCEQCCQCVGITCLCVPSLLCYPKVARAVLYATWMKTFYGRSEQ